MPSKRSPAEVRALLAQRKAANQARPCCHPGCPRHRRSVGLFCNVHEANANRWGAPDAKYLRPSRMNAQRRSIRAIALANPTHPGLRDAIRIVESWLRSRGEFTAPGRTLLHKERLLAAGVTPLDVIVELGAVRRYFDENRLDDSGDRLAFAMSQALLRLAPQATAVSERTGRPFKVRYNRPTVLREVAPPLMARIGVLIYGLAAAVDEQERRSGEFRERLATPFALPAVSYITGAPA
jgi:hypothetical protein